MKKTLFFALAVFICLMVSGEIVAETISTVSYNPSRLGQYDKIKISDGATFKKGLEVSEGMTLQNAGMQFSDNDKNKYEVKSITGGTASSIELKYAIFKNKTENKTYNASLDPDPTVTGVTLTYKGGAVKFGEDPLVEDSYVATLKKVAGSGKVRVYGKIFNGEKDTDSLQIDGNSGIEIDVLDDKGEQESTKGFYLLGGDIPYTDYNSKSPAWCSKKANPNQGSTVGNFRVLGYDCGGGSSGGDIDVQPLGCGVCPIGKPNCCQTNTGLHYCSAETTGSNGAQCLLSYTPPVLN